MSGALPPRMAATTFVSLMPPTTLTVTSGCLRSYSATTALNTLSSRDDQPTHTVSLVGALAATVRACAELLVLPAATATSASAARASRTTIVTRLIGPSWQSLATPHQAS